MGLPADFVFTQSNLQAFLDCRQLFRLRYLKKISWPAPITDPVLEHERHMQRGSIFHHMVQQLKAGIPLEVIRARINDDEQISIWWNNFLHLLPNLHMDCAQIEIPFVCQLGDWRLMAKVDYLLLESQKCIILDWKTSPQKPSRLNLARHPQTRVYCYVLCQAGHLALNSAPISPDQLSMGYWFAEHPDAIEWFEYSPSIMEDDRKYLLNIFRQINQLSDEEFDQTENLKTCLYCQYRSLCNRGVKAGNISGLEAETSGTIDLDMDSIEEISF
ncbi:MAG TPA: PD-(D/E)XK nuclease family protein [Anaerolineaceae bacterium]|nr:PD-(D/E)XK nuclease family protein [Anaerolineaceae bacterium]HPN51723.1 PD-(D/E)XK nuclease family protein [Anaerolineaceae bacterium]